jgi:hypothetical protein
MKNMLRIIPLALVAAALPAFAQDKPVELSLDLLSPTAQTKTQLLSSSFGGYQIGVGYRFTLQAADIDLRLHASLLNIKAEENASATYTDVTGISKSNMNYTFGFDMAKSVGAWTYYGGVFGVSWNPKDNRTGKYSDKGVPVATYGNPVIAVKTDNTNSPRPNGVKLGFRAGVEYAFTKEISARLGFEQMEYDLYLKPAFYSAGVVYKF